MPFKSILGMQRDNMVSSDVHGMPTGLNHLPKILDLIIYNIMFDGLILSCNCHTWDISMTICSIPDGSFVG